MSTSASEAPSPARTWVSCGGSPDAAPVRRRQPAPRLAETWVGRAESSIDVESRERALEVAAYVSSEPGPRGEPMYEWIDVREIMSHEPCE